MIFLKKFIKKNLNVFGNLLGFEKTNDRLECIHSQIRNIKDILIDDYIQKYLYENQKYANPRKLNKYEFQVYSQNGEDGIIAEIFNRIKTTNRLFVEFGVSDGLENNTLLLLLQGWGAVGLKLI